MKFENIKVGDKVLSPVVISYGWSVYEFHILKPVERITKTRFFVDGKQYTKRYGSMVGNPHYNCYNVGDSHLGTIMVDQTVEYRNCETNVKLLSKISNINVDWTLLKPNQVSGEKLKKILQARRQLKKILEE